MTMNRYFAFGALAVILLLAPVPLQSQPCRVELTMTVSYTPVEELRISDIDLKHFDSHTLLFSLAIANTNTLPVKTRLQGQLHIALATGEVFDAAATFTSDLFDVPAGGRVISNLNLGRNGDISLTDFHFDDQARSNVQDVALSTGIYPAGVYRLVLDLIPEGCQASSDEKVIEIDLRNPSRIELYSPKDGEVTGPFPFFEFYQEGTRAILTVAEKSSDVSREDAITRKPPFVEVGLTGQNSYLYTGGRPLEDGKTYVWQVQSITLGSGGDQLSLPSPIGLFTVSNTSTGGELDLLLRQLEDMFGAQYPAIFQEIHNGGFGLTGQYTLDQSSISSNALLLLLNELRGYENTVELGLE